MENKSKIKTKLEQLRERHKLSYVNESTYHEKWSFKLSGLNILTLVFLYSFLIVLIFSLLIKFTPLQKVFVANANLYELNQKLNENTVLIDSLHYKLKANDTYVADLKTILNDGEFNDSIYLKDLGVEENYQPKFDTDPIDSILRETVENQADNVMEDTEKQTIVGFYMSPVNGRVSRSLVLEDNHYGVDVVTAKDEPIKATLEGVVLFASWTANEGNVIVLQHTNSIISIYKHCSGVLVQVGDRVEIGDPIGMVGNTGEYTNGPHLHFELWQNGNVLNPQEFISF